MKPPLVGPASSGGPAPRATLATGQCGFPLGYLDNEEAGQAFCLLACVDPIAMYSAGANSAKDQMLPAFTEITPSADIRTKAHGWRAKCLQRLIRIGLPVPETVALPAASLRAIAAGQSVDVVAILNHFGADALISVRPSPENPDWGGPATVLNIGMNAARHAELVQSHGQAAADALYLRFVRGYATHVARLDPDMFDLGAPTALRDALKHYEREMDEAFPETAAQQLTEVLRSMASSVSKSVTIIKRGSCFMTLSSDLILSIASCRSSPFTDLKKSFFFQIISPSFFDRFKPPCCNRLIDALGWP